MREIEEKYGYVFLEYQFGIPMFFPTLTGEDEYSYHYSDLETKKPKEVENEIKTAIGESKLWLKNNLN